ncbi:extracellular glycoprotein lacritin isoform X2 [Mirounga leonina]|uniref:Extracellular glycoprotein lacritin n=1 Tax=Leptonychotes weddellii TaxID=9713 RepID=A0A7F8Q213_LEPWE|nr:extracellular glycoprotein lacritin [Leptonychotes weddellii]XP_034857892.1 extracellular glycoprotein lacritin isoform X2 [Mirounga leonina]XP_045723724.1 extracellular glycoprotein lacritin isoform X2 [Mirounga angustirostris]
MRFSALLFLAALAGALVYATEPEGTTSAAKPASPQEPAQEPHGATPSPEELNPLRHGLERAKKAMHKRLQFRGRLYEDVAEWDKNLKNLAAKLNVVAV